MDEVTGIQIETRQVDGSHYGEDSHICLKLNVDQVFDHL
jgi:hypothetical protein